MLHNAMTLMILMVKTHTKQMYNEKKLSQSNSNTEVYEKRGSI